MIDRWRKAGSARLRKHREAASTQRTLAGKTRAAAMAVHRRAQAMMRAALIASATTPNKHQCARPCVDIEVCMRLRSDAVAHPLNGPDLLPAVDGIAPRADRSECIQVTFGAEPDMRNIAERIGSVRAQSHAAPAGIRMKGRTRLSRRPDRRTMERRPMLPAATRACRRAVSATYLRAAFGRGALRSRDRGDVNRPRQRTAAARSAAGTEPIRALAQTCRVTRCARPAKPRR